MQLDELRLESGGQDALLALCHELQGFAARQSGYGVEGEELKGVTAALVKTMAQVR